MPAPPTIFNATNTPQSGSAPLTVAFTSSVTGGSTWASSAWNFGDGNTSTLQNPSHTYTSVGTYNPTVTVHAVNGLSGTISYYSGSPGFEPVVVSTANPQVSLSLAGNIPQFFDNNGNVLAGGYVYTYLAGSSTNLATTYVDPAGDTSNANPVQLDSAGRPNTAFWLINGNGYHFVVKARDNSTVLWSLDNVYGGESSGSGGTGGTGGTGGVSSVFGRGGAVVAQGGDYDLSQMGDVVFSGLATNDTLQYNGTRWVNLHATSVPGTISVGVRISFNPILAALPTSQAVGDVIMAYTTGGAVGARTGTPRLMFWDGSGWNPFALSSVFTG